MLGNSMLPDINSGVKPHVYFFLKKHGDSASPYQVEHIRRNRLSVAVVPATTLGCRRFCIMVDFDNDDAIKTAVDTDDSSFYTTPFYMEVLRKRQYREAWDIIRERYPSNIVVEKYIYFLVNAPRCVGDLVT